MRVTLSETVRRTMTLSDMEPGTLFYDQDGDVNLFITASEILCLCNETGGDSFIRGAWFLEDHRHEEFALVQGAVILRNTDDEDDGEGEGYEDA